MSKPDYVNRFKPSVMYGNDTASAMYDAEAEEIERIRSSSAAIFGNAFIKTANLDTIRKWEGLLGISSDSLDLDGRRELVVFEMSNRPPYTRWNFDKALESVLGKDNFIYKIDLDELMVTINLQKTPESLKPNFINRIEAILPANIRLVFSIKYTHLYLKAMYTFGEMKKFTFGELSKYKAYNS